MIYARQLAACQKSERVSPYPMGWHEFLVKPGMCQLFLVLHYDFLNFSTDSKVVAIRGYGSISFHLLVV